MKVCSASPLRSCHKLGQAQAIELGRVALVQLSKGQEILLGFLVFLGLQARHAPEKQAFRVLGVGLHSSLEKAASASANFFWR